jgi:hypothetical protein
MVEITLSVVLQIIQTIALIVGIAYYLFIMRNSQRNQELARKAQEHAAETRQAQLFMQMYNRFREDITPYELSVFTTKLSGFDEYLEKSKSDEEFRKVVNALFGFYEGLGVIVKKGYMDIELVALMWAGTTRMFYENIVEPIIEGGIKYYDYPRWQSETIYVCKELIKYMDEHPELKT